jgi:predicted permease
MDKVFLSLALIISGLTLGYLIQKLERSKTISLPIPIADLRKALQKMGLLFFMPISFLGAVWIVSFENILVVLLPVVGLCSLLFGGILALLVATMLNRKNRDKAVLYCCGSFTNIGSVGSLVCFFFFGEAGFALAALYKMLEDISYYTIGFPLVRFYSGSTEKKQSTIKRLLGVVTDPFVAAAFTAFFLGLFLNLGNITRPPAFETITAIFVPVGTFILLVSIGLGMRFSSVSRYIPESILIAAIKFVAVPLFGCTLAYIFNLHLLSDGLIFKVVLVLTSMPVAFNALVAASIYDLDLDMANSCWLVTTLTLIVILPWLYFLLASPLLPIP